MNKGAFLGSECYLYHVLHDDDEGYSTGYAGHILNNQLADPMTCVSISLLLI